MPLVSVIVTTYNRKDLLSETLNSILNQTFQDFEIIVIDNFSNYDFFSHIESFKNYKINAFQNHNNGVIAANRNFGLKHVKGNYVAFCDDDDIWFPSKLEKQVLLLRNDGNENNQEKKLIYSEVLLFGENIKEKISNRKPVRNINELIKKNQIPLSTTLMSYSDQIRFDEDPTLVACEDFDLWLKLIKHEYLFVYIEEPLVRYRLSSNSAYNSNAHLVHIRAVYVLIKHVLKYGFADIKLGKYVYVIYKELFKYYLKSLMSKFKR
jgi:teichuronic acid biosynthesis glycosyltransferase TuaG